MENELEFLTRLKKDYMKGVEDGKEKGSVKEVLERIKLLQNQRNKLNREISTLKKATLKN